MALGGPAPYDLLIKGGTVVDPSQGLNGPGDVAFAGGRVAALDRSIPESQAAQVVAAHGLIVTPGLVDLHIHGFWGASDWGIEPDPVCVAKGVTTALDAGTAGAHTFPAFRKHVLEQCDTRLYALLNISAMGVLSRGIGELQDLRWANVKKAVAVGQANREYILGIKARLGRLQAGDNDVDALKRAIEAAEALGVFLMIHVGASATPLENLAALLRPGDVVTHTFHGHDHGVLDSSGRVLETLRDAQRRGIVFDIGHGMGSFSFRVAEQALAQDFIPGTISTDLHAYSVEGPVYDQLNVLSKFLHLGLSLEEVIRLSTEAPARVMGLAGRVGTLKAGAEGDAALLRLDEGRFPLTDTMGVTVEARRKLSHVSTVRRGRLYRPYSRGNSVIFGPEYD